MSERPIGKRVDADSAGECGQAASGYVVGGESK